MDRTEEKGKLEQCSGGNETGMNAPSELEKDHTEETEKLEQCSGGNETRTNTPSELEKDHTEETEKSEQCTSEHTTRTNAYSQSEKKSISSEMWLRLIEVFFISMASLFVSFMSYRTENLEYKLNLAKSRLHVEVDCNSIDIDDDGIYDTSKLGVKYFDGFYEDFDIRSYTVITFKYIKTTGDVPKEINLIISDFFNTSYPRGDGEYFYVKVCDYNRSKYSDLFKYVHKEQKDFLMADIELSHYAIITYKNIVGDHEEMGYQGGSAGRLDTANIAQIRMDMEEYEKNGTITLEDLTPESFMRIVNELIEKQEEANKQ